MGVDVGDDMSLTNILRALMISATMIVLIIMITHLSVHGLSLSNWYACLTVTGVGEELPTLLLCPQAS